MSDFDKEYIVDCFLRITYTSHAIQCQMAPGRILFRELISIEVPKKVAFIVCVVRLWSIPKFGRSQGILAIHMVLQDEEILLGAYYPKDGLRTGTNTKGTATYQSFYLTDMSKKRIYCSLWGNYGVEAKAKLENSTAEMIVVLLQLCRVSQNDEQIPEIEEFRREFKSVGKRKSRCQSNLSGCSTTSSMNLPLPITTIAKLVDVKEVVGYYFYGKIMSVDLLAPWFYNTCPNLNRGAEVVESGVGYTCFDCKGKTVSPSPKYKVKCEVKDKENCVVLELLGEDIANMWLARPCLNWLLNLIRMELKNYQKIFLALSASRFCSKSPDIPNALTV